MCLAFKQKNVEADYVRAMLTCAPLGYSAERAPLGGGGFRPLPNSRTRGRSEVGKAANESSG